MVNDVAQIEEISNVNKEVSETKEIVSSVNKEVSNINETVSGETIKSVDEKSNEVIEDKKESVNDLETNEEIIDNKENILSEEKVEEKVQSINNEVDKEKTEENIEEKIEEKVEETQSKEDRLANIENDSKSEDKNSLEISEEKSTDAVKASQNNIREVDGKNVIDNLRITSAKLIDPKTKEAKGIRGDFDLELNIEAIGKIDSSKTYSLDRYAN